MTTMPSGSDRYVVLRGGLAVPLAPVLLLLDLERREVNVRRDGSDLLLQPGGKLTDVERAALARWKPQVLALVDYCAKPELM